MTNEIQMQDVATAMGATSIASISRTNALQPMAPVEKPGKFTGIDFKRWQKKMFFYLTTLCLQRNYILSGFQDDLYNVYSGIKTSKELCGALERKYKTDDAGIKKFFVARFLDFKMIDSKSVVSQVQEFTHINWFIGLIVNDVFQVATIIEKLPPMWKDLKNYLKYKCKEMTFEDLIVRLHIEEDNRTAERRSTINRAYIIEDDQNNSKKRKKVEQGSNQSKKKFKGKCFNCGKIDHKSTDYRAPKNSKKKDQANMIESNKECDDLCAMFSECNLVGNPREWWMDSSATRYVCANKELFSSFAPAQVEERTGKVGLKMASGKVLTLNNVLYVPELRRNLISVSLLDKNGFKLYGLEIHQMDVKTAFLNGELEEKIYMEQPEGFVVPGKENKIKFDMKDLGVADVILGIRIHRTPQELALSQSHYFENVLDKFKYMEFGIAKTPSDVSFALQKSEAGEEAKWLQNFLEDIPYWPKPVAPVCIHCDSQAVIGRAGSMMYNGKSRHIRRRHNSIRKLLSSRIITVDYVKSKDNVSNPLTKGVSREGVERTSKGMGLRPRTSQHGGWVNEKGEEKGMGRIWGGRPKDFSIDEIMYDANTKCKELINAIAKQLKIDINSIQIGD
ncbi:putative histone H2A.3-like [Capsicum annuum]|nr:putative histone H2A.3-like [Capsicum annuum]